MRYFNWARIVELLFYAIFIWAVVDLILLKANAQTTSTVPRTKICNRDMFANISKYVGVRVPVTFTDINGEQVTRMEAIAAGEYNRVEPCTFADPSRDLSILTSGIFPYSVTHWHQKACEEMLTVTSRRIAETVKEIEVFQGYLKTCKISQPCSPFAGLIKSFTGYWIFQHALEATAASRGKAPSRVDVMEHFKICVLGCDNDVNTPDCGLPQEIAFYEYLKYVALPTIKRDFARRFEVRRR